MSIRKLFINFDKVISLGCNCYFKAYYSYYLKIEEETNFFDYIGSSMWSMIDIFENDKFIDIFSSKDDFDNMEILKSDEKYIITNKKYYIRFKHEFKHNYYIYSNPNNILEKNFTKVKESYERRYYRLIEYLSSMKKLLFIRLEEEHDNRILYDEYNGKYKNTELYYLKSLSRHFKEKYSKLDFRIIYFSYSEKDNIYLQDDKIIIIVIKNKKLKYETCFKDFDILFFENYNFLLKCFI